MNENEQQRLANMANALRPDWPAKNLLTFIRNHLATKTYRDAVVALAWVATIPTTETPRLVLEAGPWWRATTLEDNRGEPRRRPTCPDHKDELQPCRRCAHNRVNADDAAHNGGPLALARAELASLRARCCTHGIDTTRGRCHDCTPPPATAPSDPTTPTREDVTP